MTPLGLDPVTANAYNGVSLGGKPGVDPGGDKEMPRRNRRGDKIVNSTLQSLRQHELVILRRLRNGPLTEFELANEIAEHSGYTPEQAADSVAGWLESLRDDGLVWAGALLNADGQQLLAAALTRQGRELVN